MQIVFFSLDRKYYKRWAQKVGCREALRGGAVHAPPLPPIGVKMARPIAPCELERIPHGRAGVPDGRHCPDRRLWATRPRQFSVRPVYGQGIRIPPSAGRYRQSGEADAFLTLTDTGNPVERER